MSWTLPPNGDIGRMEVDWLTKRVEDLTAVNKLYVLLYKLEPRRFPFGGLRIKEDELSLAARYYSKP